MLKPYLGLALIALLAGPAYVNAQSMPDFPHLNVTGQAKEEVAPDMVRLQFQIIATDENAETAVNTVTERAGHIVAMVKKLGLERSDIESWAIDKQTRRDRDPESNMLKISGYQVNQRMILTIHGLDIYENIVNELLRMPNTENLNAEFDISTREKLTRQLTAKAGKDARQRAEDMAYGLDAKLGDVYAISAGNHYPQPIAKFGMSEAQFDRAGGSRFELFAPQAITLEKQINVIFEIKP
ncbi:SIMPL domain-containing protein [Gilvimarinus xylanilyticus]|uniref:SIMPL domain-containing protein n=1 Tax=Gilvimarinus xylanilyticus TaxID=2944139 RepID=A0A9X2I647_9GAMM|nr:SIMPL domain-containing protein [Gilvimarinus xylanilyticus]MCP8899567.1 SIMPL domain-containing protein [Gilvimarinus xylanilyticus]